MKAIFTLLAVWFLLVPAWASKNGWSFNVGVFQHNMMTLTKDKAGKADNLGDTYLPLGLQYGFEATSEWSFVPSLNFTHATTAIVKKETPDEGAKKNLLFLSLPFVRKTTSWMDTKIGFGVFRYEIKGKGGYAILNNGTGTAVYRLPDKSRVAQTTYFLLGSSFPRDGWQWDVDLLINGAGSEERRSYNAYLYLTYPFN